MHKCLNCETVIPDERVMCIPCTDFLLDHKKDERFEALVENAREQGELKEKLRWNYENQ